MKLGLTWGGIAQATGGKLVKGNPDLPFNAFGLDTRSLPEGTVFWALVGERHDAHDHLKEARYASGWIVARGRWPRRKAVPQVLEVGDTLQALQRLAAFHRRRFHLPVAAVTGTNGKTTTKEMLRSICNQAGQTCANTGNLNNHIGLPLSVLELHSHHRLAVFEMGATRRGEIETLTRIADPSVAVLTNIGEAHLGYFGTVENMFEAKSELPRNMTGTVALNLDDPWLVRLRTELGERTVLYGTGPEARVRLVWPKEGRRLPGQERFRLRLAAAPLGLHGPRSSSRASGASNVPELREGAAQGAPAPKTQAAAPSPFLRRLRATSEHLPSILAPEF